MKRVMQVLLGLGLGGLVVGVGLLVMSLTRGGAARPPMVGAQGPKAPTLTIPAFELIDFTGRAHTRASLLEGKVSIVDFFFTNCPLACPVMTGQMQELQKKLAGTGVQFVSFSIDPANDTPDALRAYITQRFAIDTRNWTHLTERIEPGQQPRNVARQIFAKDLMQYVEDKPEEQIQTTGGGSMANIYHSVNFFLVGPDGVVLAWYNSQRPEELEQLRQHAIGAVKKFLSPPAP
jgi:protein SCO1/2